MTAARRTKRRYAHELYPDPSGMHTAAPLEQEVPHLYARAIGMQTWDTSWSTVDPQLRVARTVDLVNARMIAALAEAMLLGLTGDEAYAWAYSLASDESGECVFDAAQARGIDVHAIKPYPCGDEPDTHSHWGEPDRHGARWSTTVAGRESECIDCTEEVPADA
jgi:hypothetical protein